MIETKNAIIESTMLGIEDHGILTCFIYLDYGGAGQAFGGYAFDGWNKSKNRRVGVSFGMEFISRILETVGVTKWEDLKGKHIRVKCEHSKVHEIGNIIEDKWFSPKQLADELGL